MVPDKIQIRITTGLSPLILLFFVVHAQVKCVTKFQFVVFFSGSGNQKTETIELSNSKKRLF